jgi:hypothetical protein
MHDPLFILTKCLRARDKADSCMRVHYLLSFILTPPTKHKYNILSFIASWVNSIILALTNTYGIFANFVLGSSVGIALTQGIPGRRTWHLSVKGHRHHTHVVSKCAERTFSKGLGKHSAYSYSLCMSSAYSDAKTAERHIWHVCVPSGFRCMLNVIGVLGKYIIPAVEPEVFLAMQKSTTSNRFLGYKIWHCLHFSISVDLYER